MKKIFVALRPFLFLAMPSSQHTMASQSPLLCLFREHNAIVDIFFDNCAYTKSID